MKGGGDCVTRPSLAILVQSAEQLNSAVRDLLNQQSYFVPNAGRFNFKQLRDADKATGKCSDLAPLVTDFLCQRGFKAHTREENFAEEILYPEHTRFSEYIHQFTVVKIDDKTYSIDLTAAQYGINEFPAIREYYDGHWHICKMV